MKDSNTKTLATYQDNFQNYISGTTQVTTEDSSQGQWILSVIHLLPKSAKILEIGSALVEMLSLLSEEAIEILS